MIGFHVQDGLYFDRKDNGDIEVIVHEDPKEGSKVLRSFTFPPSSFASVIASMSKRNETADTYKEALDYLENR